MTKNIKSSDGYKKVKNEIIKYLNKTGLEYKFCAVVPNNNKLKPTFNCYNYEIAECITSYLETKKEIKRVKNINGDCKFDHVIIGFNEKFSTDLNQK